MPCKCDEVKEQLEIMKEEMELMRHHNGHSYSLLIEIRDRIGSECTNIMQFLYPLAMRDAARELRELQEKRNAVKERQK